MKTFFKGEASVVYLSSILILSSKSDTWTSLVGVDIFRGFAWGCQHKGCEQPAMMWPLQNTYRALKANDGPKYKAKIPSFVKEDAIQ